MSLNVAVVGLGKIGVPIAVQFASKGAYVAGYDIAAARVAEINAKHNPLQGEPGLNERLPGLVVSGHLRATTDPHDGVAAADVIVLIVPVDIDATLQPDYALLDAAVEAIAPHIKRGVLVIVETTVPVGTTRMRVASNLQHGSDLTSTTDFSVAFSPERVSSGRVLRDLATYPKIVGGIDEHSTQRAAQFYREMLDADVMCVRDAETAELSKLAETTYRDVNIALANEFARVADHHGVDVLQAIEAANSQPYSHIHTPGVGVGGHCIPVYPYFLLSEETSVVADARRANDEMASYAVSRLSAALGSLGGTTVVVLGLAYRADVKESRHSTAFRLASLLRTGGVRTFVHDPMFTPEEIRAYGLEPPPEFPLPADALIVQAWHRQYHDLDFAAFPGLRAVLDGRGVLDRERISALGLTFVGIGR